MRRANLLTISLAIVLGLMLALSINGIAGEKQTTISGTIHCIDSQGNLSVKAGVCPADHIAHLLITDDGRAIMLGGGEKVEKLIRNLVIPAGTNVKISGEMGEEFNAISVEEIALSVGAAGG